MSERFDAARKCSTPAVPSCNVVFKINELELLLITKRYLLKSNLRQNRELFLSLVTAMFGAVRRLLHRLYGMRSGLRFVVLLKEERKHFVRRVPIPVLRTTDRRWVDIVDVALSSPYQTKSLLEPTDIYNWDGKGFLDRPYKSCQEGNDRGGV